MAGGEVAFSAGKEVRNFLENGQELVSRVQATSEMHTAIIFNSKYFLKFYRKVDKGVHPDVELTRYLTDAGYPHTTKYTGSIEWRLSNGSFYLGMLEKLEENHGDGHHYMLERIGNFIERILARDRHIISNYPQKGTFTEPVAYEEIDEDLKEFIGGNAADLARLAGHRLAQIFIKIELP